MSQSAYYSSVVTEILPSNIALFRKILAFINAEFQSTFFLNDIFNLTCSKTKREVYLQTIYQRVLNFAKLNTLEFDFQEEVPFDNRKADFFVFDEKMGSYFLEMKFINLGEGVHNSIVNTLIKQLNTIPTSFQDFHPLRIGMLCYVFDTQSDSFSEGKEIFNEDLELARYKIDTILNDNGYTLLSNMFRPVFYDQKTLRTFHIDYVVEKDMMEYFTENPVLIWNDNEGYTERILDEYFEKYISINSSNFKKDHWIVDMSPEQWALIVKDINNDGKSHYHQWTEILDIEFDLFGKQKKYDDAKYLYT